MNTPATLPTPGVPSPFDSLKQVRPDGSEFWSARDLMVPLGYSAWRNLAVPVERAMRSAANQGHDVTLNFARSRKVAPSGPDADDLHLSRFAAYLVAMNGDPNKPEVAAAQAYFAIRTREAETTPALTGPELMAKALIEANSTMLAQADRIAALEPKAQVAERFLAALGDLSVNEAAKALERAGVPASPNKLFDTLVNLRWVSVRRARGQKQYAAYQERIKSGHLKQKVTNYRDPRSGRTYVTTQIRITPKGLNTLANQIGTN